jgi:hypothetical protein
MKTFVVAMVLFSGAAWAEDAASPAVPQPEPNAMLAPGSIAVPGQIVQGLMIYLADRPGIAAQFQQGIAQAAQAKPQMCPVPAP